jgi:hypothetical protein
MLGMLRHEVEILLKAGHPKTEVARLAGVVAQFESTALRIVPETGRYYFFESSRLKWLSTSSRPSGFLFWSIFCFGQYDRIRRAS